MDEAQETTQAQPQDEAQGQVGETGAGGTLEGGTESGYATLLSRIEAQEKRIADLEAVIEDSPNAEDEQATAPSTSSEGKLMKLLARHGIHENPELDEIEEANAAAGEPTEEQKANESERKSVDAEQELENIHQRIAARDISRAK